MNNIYNIQKSEEEIKLEEARRQAEYRKNILIAFASALYVAYKDFWYGSITPQEQCDLLGEDAFELFNRHAKGVQFILENLPNVTDFIPDFIDTTHVPLDKEVNIVDGKIVITEK